MASKHSTKLWLYGKHAVMAALQNKQRQRFKLLMTKSIADELRPLLDSIKITPQIVSNQQLEQILPKSSLHQGIAFETSSVIIDGIESLYQAVIPAQAGIQSLRTCLIALDQISDQNNIGAILRSAAAFDISGVITLADNTPSETSHIAKAASGALEIVPLIKVTNLAQTIKYLQERGFWVIGLDGGGDQYLDEIKLPEKTLFIAGSESSGLRRLTREKCDYIAKIRISSRMESLNVSVATALAMQYFYTSLRGA